MDLQCKLKNKLKNKLKLLIGCTGAFDADQIGVLIKTLLDCKCFEIKVVMTKAALYFAKEIMEGLDKEDIVVYGANDEFDEYSKDKGNVLHIELRRWADVILLAPLTANTLAKITNGFSDNLLTCILRAWDFSKPGFYSLSMDSLMYNHPLTSIQVTILNEDFHFNPIITNTSITTAINEHHSLASPYIILNTLLTYFDNSL